MSGFLRCTVLVVLPVMLCASAVAQDQYRGAADCEAFARNEARNAGRVVGGAARGAARGAILGGIIGDSSKAARRGATLGAIAGGARRAAERERVYQQAYEMCMADMRRGAKEQRESKEESNNDS